MTKLGAVGAIAAMVAMSQLQHMDDKIPVHVLDFGGREIGRLAASSSVYKCCCGTSAPERLCELKKRDAHKWKGGCGALAGVGMNDYKHKRLGTGMCAIMASSVHDVCAGAPSGACT